MGSKKFLGYRNPRLATPLLSAFIASWVVLAVGAAAEPSAVDRPDEAISLLERYCFDCHGPDVQEANLRLDTIDSLGDGYEAGRRLQSVLDKVASGQMPPEEAELPTDTDREHLIKGLDHRLEQLSLAAWRTGRLTPNRRLTLEEYHRTMQELFGVDAMFTGGLPADPISPQGYRNSVELLGFSSLQIEAYLDAAREAVRRYVIIGDERPPAVRYHIELEDLFYSTADRYETLRRAPQPIDLTTFDARRTANATTEPAFVDPLGPQLAGAFSEDEAFRAAIPKLHQQYVALPQYIESGELIIRVRAAGTADRNGRPPRMRVEAGITLGDGCAMDKRLLGEVDVVATLDRPQMYEFRFRMEDVPTKGPLRIDQTFDQLSVFDMNQIFISNASCDDAAIFALGRGGYRTPAQGTEAIAADLQRLSDAGVNLLHLDCVEVEMLPDVAATGEYRWQIATDSLAGDFAREFDVMRRLLTEFMPAAFRRFVSADEVQHKLALWSDLRTGGHSFEASCRETLAAVLISPSFLFIETTAPGWSPDSDQAKAFRLGCRLSYLVWQSPPDEELRQRIEDGSILDRDVYRQQAVRLLEDERAERFILSFARQWLRLDKHSNIAVDRATYPFYDQDFAAAAVQETLTSVKDVFAGDRSALELIDADHIYVNDRLASHYDLSPTTSGDFQRIDLPEGSVRGGLLTQASILTINSNGVDSHPIRRGVWLLERLLDAPPPPPPPNVPEIDADDPDFRGLSLRQRIELHRSPGSCRGCHEKIDPWGLPLENFDAVGQWRDDFDASTTLPGGLRIDDVEGLKAYLINQRSEQFARAVVQHMLTYCLGRPPLYVETSQADEILERFEASGHRLRPLVLAIIESRAFCDGPAVETENAP